MAALLRRTTVPLCQCHRAAFSTSAPRAISLQLDRNDPEVVADALPPYPYGPTLWYKQSSKGLYGGQRIQFGNNVSKKFENKTRRTWHPNVFNKKLWSKALSRLVQVRVSARVLRTIDKLGGLDEYLLGEKEARIKELGESGWWLRWAIMQTPHVKKRFAAERRALGLPNDPQQLEAMENAPSVPGEDVQVVTEPVAQVEHKLGPKPIKFRVGPRKHVMLTAKGWVRSKPSREWFATKAKEELRKKYFANLVTERLQHFKRNLRIHQKEAKSKGGVVLSVNEEKALCNSARDDLIAWRNKIIDRRYREIVASHKQKIARRRDRRRAAKRAEKRREEN